MFWCFSNKFIFNGIRRDASVATFYFYKDFCPAKTPVILVGGGESVGGRYVGRGETECAFLTGGGVFRG